MKRNVAIMVVVAAVVLGTGFWILKKAVDEQPPIGLQVKSAHFESSTPAHNSFLPAAPPQVAIDFNFDLSGQSTINILKDDVEYATGVTTVDTNKLAMRRPMDSTAPDGTYLVKYKACWPDGSCHNGQFNFHLQRSLADNYEDKRNQPAVTINMSSIKFQPMNLRISKGTVVTWVNDDGVDHYVNTDSHPAHTHQPDLNSKALKKGETYSYTFNETGAYPYHCSAHADNMTGTIIVE